MSQQVLKKRGTYAQFLGYEAAIWVVSLIASYIGTGYIYYPISGFWNTVASLLPNPITLSGFALTYALIAILIGGAISSLLFFARLRQV